MNYPLNETYATLIPALLMGNVVLMKVPTVGKKILYAFLVCHGAFNGGSHSEYFCYASRSSYAGGLVHLLVS